MVDSQKEQEEEEAIRKRVMTRFRSLNLAREEIDTDAEMNNEAEIENQDSILCLYSSEDGNGNKYGHGLEYNQYSGSLA